jgi:hypothetical protein
LRVAGVLAEGLPTIEIELPRDCVAARGDLLAVRFVTVRLFADQPNAPAARNSSISGAL